MDVRTDNLIKRYGGFELSLPDLHIHSGESVGLVGNNGAGKTTFLRLILDLIRPDEGAVLIDGRNVADESGWRENTGSYLDEGFLIDFLTSKEFLEFTASVYRMDASETGRDRFDDFLMTGAQEKYIRDLSQGNRKKVGLVAALMIAPRLLILDEPFSGLDPRSQIQLKALLREAHEQLGATLVISSHDLDHVTDVCDRIAILEGGRIVREQSVSAETLNELKEYFSSEIRAAGEARTA